MRKDFGFRYCSRLFVTNIVQLWTNYDQKIRLVIYR